MFTLLKSVFQTLKNNATTSTLASPSAPQEASSDSQNNTWVYIWNMTANKVGHAAIQIGGASPKIIEKDQGEYISLHPGSFPSTGLTSVLPLPAHVAGTLSEDMEIIATPRNPTNINADMLPVTIEQESVSAVLLPDQILKINGLDANAMRDYIQQTQTKVESGEESYQLFPNVNLVGLIHDSAAFVNQDPIDVWIHQRFSEKYQKTDSRVDNCTSLVSKILNAGGLHINPSKMPWAITPNGLADEIRNNPK